MAAAAIHVVRLEPVGIEMEVEEGETVLDAAFRQGIAVPHGCKEGRCASCKCQLVEGDAEMLRYSTFALNDAEKESGHILLCRTHVYSDIVVELLNYDEDMLRRSIPVKEFEGTLAGIEALTHDIRLLRVEMSEPMRCWAGQFCDVTIPGTGITRSYSMASLPSSSTLEFIIKKYPSGAFSSLLDGDLQVGSRVVVKGPYGTCFRREERPGPMILVGGGSGMSPLWAILNDHVRSGEHRPVRFFYGARTRADLFYLDKFAALAAQVPGFRFIPVLSHAAEDTEWTGERGFVHEALARHLLAEDFDPEQVDAYLCGPGPMIDAALPVLQMQGVEPDRIFVDRFTPATQPAAVV